MRRHTASYICRCYCDSEMMSDATGRSRETLEKLSRRLTGIAPVLAGLGAGVAGFNACVVAVGLGAEVTILDLNPQPLSYVRDVVQGHVTTLMSNVANVESSVAEADLVIAGVLIPGGKAPTLISRELLRQMDSGSALVDVSVDQGGCANVLTTEKPSRIDHGNGQMIACAGIQKA